jgi:hypothetical protein
MKVLAPDLEIAYNARVPRSYRQARRFAKSRPGGIAGDRIPSRIPRAEVRAMTYMLYKVLRRLPRPVLLGLLLVLLTAVVRA